MLLSLIRRSAGRFQDNDSASRFVGTSLFKDETLSDQVTLYYCQGRKNLNVHNIHLFMLRPSRKEMDYRVMSSPIFFVHSQTSLLIYQMKEQLSNTNVGNGF